MFRDQVGVGDRTSILEIRQSLLLLMGQREVLVVLGPLVPQVVQELLVLLLEQRGLEVRVVLLPVRLEPLVVRGVLGERVVRVVLE